MKRFLLIIAAIVGLTIAWLTLGRQLVLLVDTFATEGEAVATNGPFIYSMGSLHVGNIPLDLTTPDGTPDTARFEAETTGRVSLHASGKVFPLGTRNDAAAEIADPLAGPYDTLFTPDPGDTVTFRTAHSAIAWPTPFELNFMTGKSPSWRRNTYYTLIWRKPDGATLTITWRYEQWFYDDWASPMMISPSRTGLIRADIDGGL
ncbi:MAG: hypothetical protein SGI91_17645 [Alphaproteobacteria bacterium]|nr:hypothetical protein [Alphaproteobacteria bacterium]